MNYIELINKFWLTNESHSFRTTDIALFFYLLKINNACSWKEYFKRKNIQIQADLDISYNTLKEARNRLKQAKILDFKSKNGSGDVAYTLSNFDDVTDKVNPEYSTSSKNDEVTAEVAAEVGSEVGSEVSLAHINGTCNKTKLNKTKEFIPNIGDTAFSEVLEKSLPDCYNALIGDQMWMECVCMNNHITADKFISKLQEFFKKLQNEGEKTKSVKDGQSHFARWLAIDIQKQKKNKPNPSTIPNKGKIESVGESVEEALRIMRNG